jgi:hypothetical protein
MGRRLQRSGDRGGSKRVSGRGQAAMEFFVTYGWAFLIVLVTLAVLAYFGVIDPSKLLPSQCTVGGGFSCTQYKVTGTQVQLGIQNNLGVDADHVNISFSSSDCAGTGEPLPAVLAYQWVQNGALLNGTALSTFTCTLVGKSRMKGSFSITYVRSGETLSHATTGTIQSGVET